MKLTLTLAEITALVINRYNLPADTEVEIKRPCVSYKNKAEAGRLIHSLRYVPAIGFDSTGATESVFDGNNNIRRDKLIPAIKQLRTIVPGLGLADAKHAIEDWPNFIAYVQANGLPPVNNFRW